VGFIVRCLLYLTFEVCEFSPDVYKDVLDDNLFSLHRKMLVVSGVLERKVIQDETLSLI
jgi:hypothetical protein